MRLDSLTAEQQGLLPGVRNEWIRTGLSTEPADRAAAEAGVRKAYEAAGLEPPRLVIWLDSPMAGAIGQAMLRSLPAQVRAQVRDQVWAQVWDQVGDQVGAQVWAQVGDQVGAQVGAQVRDQVGDQVWAQVWDQVGAQVGDQVWAQVGDQVGDQVWDQVGAQVGDWYSGSLGRWETGWLAFYDAFARLGIDTTRLTGLTAVERSAGWWWPLAGAVVITDRPTVIARDKDGRLHSADGPAVLYRDGFAVHAWHGTRVPPDLVETGWDTKRIFAESNTEIRRCAIERMGWDRFIAVAGLRRVGEEAVDPGNAPYTIALYDLPDELADMYEERARILLCTNGSPERDGTRHRFGLVVPGRHTHPIAAAASLYDIPVAAYAALEVRR